jgi:hypothetical protein
MIIAGQKSKAPEEVSELIVDSAWLVGAIRLDSALSLFRKEGMGHSAENPIARILRPMILLSWSSD